MDPQTWRTRLLLHDIVKPPLIYRDALITCRGKGRKYFHRYLTRLFVVNQPRSVARFVRFRRELIGIHLPSRDGLEQEGAEVAQTTRGSAHFVTWISAQLMFYNTGREGGRSAIPSEEEGKPQPGKDSNSQFTHRENEKTNKSGERSIPE